MFIKQVFYGILEKKDFLKATTKEFLKSHQGTTEIADELLYTIIIYLAVFRMNELSLDDFKSLVLVN